MDGKQPKQPLIDRTRTGQLVAVLGLVGVYVVLTVQHQPVPPMLSQALIAAVGTYVAGRGVSAAQEKGHPNEA